MKFLFFFIIIILTISCTNNKEVYWCGDHPCINKKERSAYFKKTMSVEIRDLSSNDKKNKSELEKIGEQVLIDEKKKVKEEKALAKQLRLDEKRRIKDEKALAKQLRLDEKRRIKEEKKLSKRSKSSKKIIIKEKNKLTKKTSDQEVLLSLKNLSKDSSEFDIFVEKINKKNKFKPFPDINDIPN